MDRYEFELQRLIEKGQTQGYLTYDEVNSYLPDEDVNPEKLDNLLIALEEQGIELVAEAPVAVPVPPAPSAAQVSRRSKSNRSLPRRALRPPN